MLRRGRRRASCRSRTSILPTRRRTSRRGEFVAAVRVPRARAGRACRSYKSVKRYDQDISAVCAAFCARTARRARARAARIASAAWRRCRSGRGASSRRSRCGAGTRARSRKRVAGAGAATSGRSRDMRAIAGLPRAASRGNLLRRFYCDVAQRGSRECLELCRLTARRASTRPVAAGQRGAPHESAHLHVSGEALYVDDIPLPAGHAARGVRHEQQRARTHSRRSISTRVRAAPGVVAVLTAADIPGENNHGPVVHDDPIFADDWSSTPDSRCSLWSRRSFEAARRAARLARRRLRGAARRSSTCGPRSRGSLRHAEPALRARRARTPRLAARPHRLQGTLAIGGQDHFYLEGQIAVALPREDGTMLVLSARRSTRARCSTSSRMPRICGRKDVVVQCRRMGGGFGGKESQPALVRLRRPRWRAQDRPAREAARWIAMPTC